MVIPYYDNPEGLREVVAGVEKQDYPGELEIIVADDGSAVPPPDLGTIIVRQEDLGFRAAAARNLGAAQATGDVLTFFDGDTVPEPGYLTAVVPHVLVDVRSVIVGTRLTGLDREEPAWLVDAWKHTGHLQHADDSSWRFIISATLTCTRDFFTEIGGFDASLIGYGGEDWDLGHRAWQHGARFIHEPTAIAVHDEPDWGARSADAGEKNAETVALAHRITHPLARPAGVIFDTADIAVHVPGWPEPGVTEAVIIGWLTAGDIHVLIDAVPDLFRADPRVRTTTTGQRLTVKLLAPVVPDVPVPDLRPGRYVLDGVEVARVRSRRYSGDDTVTCTWRKVTGPRRLERDFAGW